MTSGQDDHGEPSAPNQQNQEAKDSDKTDMSGMSAEEHAKMMRGNSGDEKSPAMSQGSISGIDGMSGAGHGDMMWRESLWASFVNLLLGSWLITSPFAFGYQSAGMTWSDVISGLLVIVFSLLAASRKFNAYARWAVCFVGIWLLFAPLVFWSPTSSGYLNDTLVGALLIAFSVLVTMMPGMDMSVMDGADIPPGWSYNPSSWLQRTPIILLALVGFLASRYMAAYQLGYITSVYDPFFGDGTRQVLTSDVSKMFPISDAGLGSVSYVLEMLMGFMGDKARWRTMPWMVTFFGILVVPLGTVSIVLIILQPLAVGAWCSLCLLAAIAMLAMIPATLDEVVAMLQFLVQAKREDKALWRTFWFGGTVKGIRDDKLTPFDWSNPFRVLKTWLFSNWNLLICAAFGVWLIFAPWMLNTTGSAADSDHLIGALIVTFAVIAMAEVGRSARFINILLGAWLITAPFLLSGFTTNAFGNGIFVGIALVMLSFPRGTPRERYGGFERYIR
ncbi:MAG: vitamin K epoxide reductase family protein [Pyrinomonadaceae bacterium]